MIKKLMHCVISFRVSRSLMSDRNWNISLCLHPSGVDGQFVSSLPYMLFCNANLYFNLIKALQGEQIGAEAPVGSFNPVFFNSGPRDPPPCMFSMFPSSTTPDWNDQLVIQLCSGLIRSHSFESGVLEEGNMENMQGSGRWKRPL